MFQDLTLPPPPFSFSHLAFLPSSLAEHGFKHLGDKALLGPGQAAEPLAFHEDIEQ